MKVDYDKYKWQRTNETKIKQLVCEQWTSGI